MSAKPKSPELRPKIRWKRFRLTALLGCALVLTAPWATAGIHSDGGYHDCNTSGAAAPYKGTAVIIIDDVGNSLRRGRDAIALPGKITYAVIPHTPHAEELARTAVEAGKEVMLHAPMSTLEDTPLGPGGLTPDLEREAFLERLRQALRAVPQSRGVNNHMGSDLTQRRQQMAWLMQELRWRDLYFVDSRTSDKTVAALVASEFNVPHLSRKVFLDNEASEAAIHERFSTLIDIIHRDGMAVAIGHPYRATINYLQKALPALQAEGIELALVSDVVFPDKSRGEGGAATVSSPDKAERCTDATARHSGPGAAAVTTTATAPQTDPVSSAVR